MSDINSLLGGGNQTQTDLLVESYLQTQQPKLNSIQNKKSELEAKNSFFTALNTRINAIVTQIDTFQANDFDKKFGVKIDEADLEAKILDKVESLKEIKPLLLDKKDLDIDKIRDFFTKKSISYLKNFIF